MNGILGAGLAMGLAGTVTMDLWTVLLNRLQGKGFPQWSNPGRWFVHLFRGRVFHDDIAAAEPIAGENAIGWAFHYAVGLIYGVIFAVIAGPDWLAAPTFVPVWIFGLVTIAAGWFLLHPGMGMGWALSRTATPWQGRIMGLAAHTVFAIGMYAAAVL